MSERLAKRKWKQPYSYSRGHLRRTSYNMLQCYQMVMAKHTMPSLKAVYDDIKVANKLHKSSTITNRP